VGKRKGREGHTLTLQLEPHEEEMLIGLVGERLDDLELSTMARLALESIYHKLNGEDN
jgi:hypothetical protein